MTVHPRRAVSLRTTLIVFSALFFSVLGGAVGIQAQRIENQHRLDQIELDLIHEQELHRQLRADVAVAESPGRIMAEASALGMVEPGPVLPLVSPGVADAQEAASQTALSDVDAAEVDAADTDAAEIDATVGGPEEQARATTEGAPTR